MLPMKEAIGLPMSGKVDFSFDLDLPNQEAQDRPRGTELAEGRRRRDVRVPERLHVRRRQDEAKPKLKNNRNQRSRKAASSSASSTSRRWPRRSTSAKVT